MPLFYRISRAPSPAGPRSLHPFRPKDFGFLALRFLLPSKVAVSPADSSVFMSTAHWNPIHVEETPCWFSQFATATSI
jgi:hypothetical protein